MFVYQRQTAWVRWGSARSSCFGVLNGTRQGSVLSPCIFAIYMDDLLEELRNLGVGCHIGDVFLGLLMMWSCLPHPEQQSSSCWKFVKSLGLGIISSTALIQIQQRARLNVCLCVESKATLSTLHHFCFMAWNFPGLNWDTSWQWAAPVLQYGFWCKV